MKRNREQREATLKDAKDVALKTGINYQSIWNYLKGRRSVNRDEDIIKLIEAGYKIEPFLLGEKWKERVVS